MKQANAINEAMAIVSDAQVTAYVEKNEVGWQILQRIKNRLIDEARKAAQLMMAE